VDLDELQKLLQILEEKQITEFELEEQGVKLRIRKGSANHAPAPSVVSSPALSAALAAAAAAPVPAAAAAAPAPAPAAVEEPGLVLVKSPIVGTFYRSPDPNSPSFVEVGARVKPGQVLCIVEAMKLMNEIEAEMGGEVVKVHPQNGQPIQYGDPLFTIRPD
jgi:acetyl-CoA carboxylase biotin carboxyl carrier protein